LIVCQIEDIEGYSKNDFGWKLGNFRNIEPFPVKGQLGLFNVPDELVIFRPDITNENADEFFRKFFLPLFY